MGFSLKCRRGSIYVLGRTTLRGYQMELRLIDASLRHGQHSRSDEARTFSARHERKSAGTILRDIRTVNGIFDGVCCQLGFPHIGKLATA